MPASEGGRGPARERRIERRSCPGFLAATLRAAGALGLEMSRTPAKAGSRTRRDLAGADLLVHQAGGAMTNVVGRSLTYNQPGLVRGARVAAGADRHAALVALCRE